MPMNNKYTCTLLVVMLMLLFTSCNKLDSTDHIEPTEYPINYDYVSNKDITKSPDNNFFEDKEYFSGIPIENIQKAINDHYIYSYRRHNMSANPSEVVDEGVELNYDVFYIGDYYMLVKFDDKNAYYYDEATFYISSRKTVQYNRYPDRDKLTELYNSTDLPYVCSGGFIVNSNLYDDFEGKDEIIDNLIDKIRYRYFDLSNEKPLYEYPIFYETTNASKVFLLDFDDKSKNQYNILVFTEDDYVYNASIHYVEIENVCEFFEIALASYKMQDISDYDEKTSTDKNLSSFMNYYNNALNHIINVIDK